MASDTYGRRCRSVSAARAKLRHRPPLRLGGGDHSAGHDPLGVLVEVTLAHFEEPPNAQVDELVADVAALTPSFDESAEAQTGQMRRDARLIAPDVADDLARGLGAVEQELKDPDARGVGEPVEEAGDDLRVFGIELHSPFGRARCGHLATTLARAGSLAAA